MTDLPNRNECRKRLKEWYALCDDQYGHAAGDAVLKETTRRLKDALFVRDFIARIGGDEFIAIVDGVLDDEKAIALALPTPTSTRNQSKH